MPSSERATFETIPVRASVTWHYRGAIGHGTIIGVHEMGTTADTTMYSVRRFVPPRVDRAEPVSSFVSTIRSAFAKAIEVDHGKAGVK